MTTHPDAALRDRIHRALRTARALDPDDGTVPLHLPGRRVWTSPDQLIDTIAHAVADATSIRPVIATRIRAELVCCTIADTGDPDHARETGHDICYWGEMAARLAEETDQP